MQGFGLVQRGIDYVAQVTALGTAAEYLMVQVDVPELFAGAEPDALPWATYSLPLGARENEGDFSPVDVGDWVWVDFPFVTHGEVDTRRPRIKGAMLSAPNKVPTMPHELFDGKEKLVHKRTASEPKPVAAAPFQARVITVGECTVEIEKAGAFRITNRPTGTSFEITKDGEVVNHSETDQFMSATKKTLVESGESVDVHAPKINLGKSGLEPIVLGNALAAFFESFKAIFENHKHIGNLGVPTSPMVTADGPVDFTPVLKNGKAYSTKNNSQ